MTEVGKVLDVEKLVSGYAEAEQSFTPPLEGLEIEEEDMGPVPLAYSPDPDAAEHFFALAEKYRPLFGNIQIMVPVRPTEGLPPQMVEMLAIWSLAGVRWGTLEDPFGGFIECTRARMAYEFVRKTDLGFLLMMDSDMKPPMHLPWLLARHMAPVVGSVAISINADFGPMLCLCRKDSEGLWRYPRVHAGNKFPSRGLVPVGAVGTGAMLIRRDVLEAFDYEDPESEIPFFLPEGIRRQGFKTGHLNRGEDIQFCLQVRKMGFEVAVDMEAIVGHSKRMSFLLEPQLRDDSIDGSTWVVPCEGMISEACDGAD